MKEKNQIPKVIHYFWVGGTKKPKSVLACLDSWKKHYPDFEIIEWNENNYDFSKNKYMQQAYDSKKWGFVPDYARLDVIYEYGGFYFDTDVEVIARNEKLLSLEAFIGFENTGDGKLFVNCGQGFGAMPGNEIIKKARDMYDDICFINTDGSLNLVPSPNYTTEILVQNGLQLINKDQKLNGITVFASDVFCPKNFRTGKVHKTSRTLSIHHFVASWMDDEIKRNLRHQQRISTIVGRRNVWRVLYVESVLQKYAGQKLFTVLPKRAAQKIKARIIELLEERPYYQSVKKAAKIKQNAGEMIILDTSMDSDNCGDEIIMENCMMQLSSLLDTKKMIHIPTHRHITDHEREELIASKGKILCGTNILSGRMRKYGLWKLPQDVSPFVNTILMGTGFDSNSSSFDKYSKLFFRSVLSKDYLHSVRDSFSEEKLKSIGVHNVINTACPTMWILTPEKCNRIPAAKSKDVICTLTDYNQDSVLDRMMMEVLFECYERVFFWVQGDYDYEYLKNLGYDQKVIIIPKSLKSFDEMLEKHDIDYVGTRLHAGIRAMSFERRSIIISIDNRAECIAADTNLPVIKRKDLGYQLKEMINSEFKTELNLPWDSISRWKNQFGPL